MNRIATRTFVLLVSGLLALGTASACASEDTTSSAFPKIVDAGHKKADAGRPCVPAYCPMPASGAPCCLNNVCGADQGNGCVPFNKKDAGR